MDSLTFDIKISNEAREIGSKIYSTTDKTLFETGLSKITQNIFNYDDYVFAGRLKLNEIVRSVNSIDMYLILNKNILAPHIYDYFEHHKGVFDALIKEYEKDNYTNQDYFSAVTLSETYLLKSIHNKSPSETPVLKNLRLAVQFYYDESLDSVLKAFHELCKSYYTHATPTLCNAGCKIPQMASCFLMGVDDNLESMMYTGIGDMGMISRYNGGVGIGLNNIRHSDIAGTGNSAGVLPYARICDKAIGYVDQSRTRRGAATGFLDIWHIDVMKFIESASNFVSHDQQLVDLHTCIWMHDLFFERYAKGENWTLFCPNTVKELKGLYGSEFEEKYKYFEGLAPITEKNFVEANKEYDEIRNILKNTEVYTPEQQERFSKAFKNLHKCRKERIVYETVKAQDILVLIAKTQLQSGKPYIMNGDRANLKSNQQNIGPINNSNLCVEIVQFSDANRFSSCNLASINLPAFAKSKYPNFELVKDIKLELAKHYDFKELGYITRSVVNNLNKVIDHNFYPFDPSKIKDLNMATRPLGIGISGLDDAFKVLDLVYGSDESIMLNKMIFACIYYNALLESNKLAMRHGKYEYFDTGSFKLFDADKKEDVVYSGSPLSNGFLQFDLWQKEYQRDVYLGRDKPYYNPNDNDPIEPKYFGIDSSWSDLRKLIMEHGVRNSLLTALMPTATTAQVLRNAETAECHQKNIYVRKTKNGSFFIYNRHLYKDLDEINLRQDKVIDYIYNNVGKLDGLKEFVKNNITKDLLTLSRVEYLEKKYKVMFDIKPSLFLKMARQRGIYIDQSQSTNIYIKGPSLSELMAVQMVAYYLRLKTHIYYLRNEIETLNTGFNKKVSDATIFIEEEPKACKLNDPDCMSCGS